MTRQAVRITAVLALVALAGCAAFGIGAEGKFLQAWNAVGQTFVETGEMYNRLLDSKLVTPEEYRKWAKFANEFKARHAQIYQVYKIGRDADTSTESLLKLKSELLVFLLSAVQKEIK